MTWLGGASLVRSEMDCGCTYAVCFVCVYVHFTSQAATSFGMVFSKPLRLPRSRCRLAKVGRCLPLSSKPQENPARSSTLSWFCWQALRSPAPGLHAVFRRQSLHQLSRYAVVRPPATHQARARANIQVSVLCIMPRPRSGCFAEISDSIAATLLPHGDASR